MINCPYQIKKTLIFTIILLSFLSIRGQEFYEIINEEVCDKIENINIANTSKTELKELMIKYLGNSITKNPKSLSNLKSKFKKDFPDFTIADINYKIRIDLLLYLFDNCPKYLEINQKYSQIRDFPNKKCLQLIYNDMCSDLTNVNSKDYVELDKKIYEFMGKYIVKYARQIEQDYIGGIKEPNFREDLIAYLMRYCGIYYKIVIKMSSQ